MDTRFGTLGSAAVGIAVAAALASCTSTGTAGDQTPSNAPPGESDYADGRYSADGQYGGLPSSIGVTVTLVNDVVTDVSVVPHATDPTSLDLQNRFAAAVPAVIVGRDIDTIQVDRIAGSSATPDGFNAALERIKAEAAVAGMLFQPGAGGVIE
ncbi:MAG: hypothetical protein JWN19_261 [Arthrobacter sp.]|jgi:hypothetical protein|nr:hypothetical protein [Arthrobacter sp.]